MFCGETEIASPEFHLPGLPKVKEDRAGQERLGEGVQTERVKSDGMAVMRRPQQRP